MKKVILGLFLAFILLGMLFGSANIPAKGEGNSDSDDYDNSLSADDNEDEFEDSSDDELENEDEDDSNEIKEHIRTQTQSEFSKEVIAGNGSVVKIEKEVEVEDGKVKIKIKRTITFADGSKQVIEIEIERDEEGVSKEIKIEGENINLDSDLEINDLFEGNESELEAVLSNGNSTKIKILPEQARIRVRERLRTENITNFSLEERMHKNIPRVVYNIETNQNGRFLGVFKLALKSETQIDPETGEILNINQPWWAFLVSVPEEAEEDETDTGEDETEISLINYEEALQIAESSNCTAEGNLTDEHWYNGGTRTWWIDLDLIIEGCNPTCVVNEETRTAEINYMCTGLA